MAQVIQIIHWLAAVLVLAEALNKLERTTPCAPGLAPRQRLIDGLKAASWALTALGAGGAIISPILGGIAVRASSAQILIHSAPSISDTAIMLGVAILIIRTRVKEG